MDAAQLVRLALQISIFLIVLALGLRASITDATSIFREPRMLLRSIVAMYVLMPVAVGVIVVAMDLHPAVKVALVALAISPVPPFLPGKELKLVARERYAYVYGLLAATSVLAIVVVPLAVALLEALLDRDLPVPPYTVASIVAVSVLLPLVAGMTLRWRFPAAERLSSSINAVASIALVLVLLVLLARTWPAMLDLVGDGTLAAIAAATLIGLTIGHLLGGPASDNRTVLAHATSSRHPAVKLAIASGAHQDLEPAAIVLALIVSNLIAAPYVAWRKRSRVPASVSGTDLESR